MNKIKTGDKVKWGKRKGIFTVERLEEVDVVIVDQNRWEYPVSPSELTKVPKRAVKKTMQEICDQNEISLEQERKTMLENVPKLRKVGIDYGHEDLVDSVAYLWASARNKKEVNNWPNGYTLAFVLAGILFVIAYCVGMANI